MATQATQEELAKDWLSRASGKWRLQVLQRRGRNAPVPGGWERRELPLRLRRFLNGTPVGLVHDVLRLLDTDRELRDPVFNWEPAGTVDPEKYKPVRTYIVKDGNPNESNGRDPTYTIVQDLRLASDDGDEETVPDLSSCAQESETKYVWDATDVEAAPAGGQGVSWRVTNVSRDAETDLYSYQLRKEVAVTQHRRPQVTECGGFETVTQESWDNLYGAPGAFKDQDDHAVDVPAPCNAPYGTTVRVQVSENPDCTFRVVVTKSVAKRATQVTEARKSLRGVTETEKVVATSPLPETGLALGEQVRNELRPDGLYDVTHVTVSKTSVGDIGSDCETTVFQHTHVESENVATRPEDEAGSAGGGKTYRVQSRATEEGTWDVTRTETTELAVTDAQKSKQKTLRGVTETTVQRNVDDGTVPATLALGQRVQVERTPGGKWNRTETVVLSESVGDIGSDCETTVFQHTHVESENVATRPEDEAGSAGGGKTYRVQSRATEEGTWDVSRTVTEEKAVTGAQHIMRKTLRGVTETFVHRNVEDSSVSVSEIGDEVRVEQTPGGRWNRTETRASHEAVGAIGKSCTVTPVVHTDVTVSNVPNGSQPEPRHQIAEVNVEKSVEIRRTEEGTWDVTERMTEHEEELTYKASPVAKAVLWDSTVEQHQVINSEDAPTDLSEADGKAIVNLSAAMNDHGSFDGRWQVVTAGRYEEWEALTDMERLYRRKVWFRHATKTEYENKVQALTSAFNTKVEGWISADRPPTSYDVTADVRPEEYRNRYSGSVTMEARWSSQAAGQTGAVEAEIAHAYTYSSKTTKAGKVKYHRDEHWIGRGKAKLDALIGAAHGDGTNVYRISGYSYRDDSTWSLTVTEDNW